MTQGGVLRGRHGTLCHRWSPCVARVGPGDIDFAFLWFSQSGLAQLFCSFFPWLCFCAPFWFCAPFSARWSVLPAQLPKSIKTDLPSSSALHLLRCAPCSFWLSVLAAQRPKSFKTDLPSSPSPGLLGGAPCCFWWPALVREPPKFFKAGLPSCSFVLCPPFSCDCAFVLLSLSDTPLCPLSGPHPPKRSARLPSLLCRVVRFGLLAAQILQNGPLQLFHGQKRPCSCTHTGTATSSHESWRWVSFPFSPWCSILSAERIKCSKADLAILVCLAVLLALPPVAFPLVLAAQQPKSSKTLSLWWSVLAAQQPKSSAERAKTDHQKPSQADQVGEVRFGGFGLLSGQNRPPEGKRFGGFGLLGGQNEPPEGEQGAQPSRTSWRRSTKRGTRERQGQRTSSFSPASLDTEVVPVSAFSFPGCLLVAVAFCEILSGYTGFLPQFADRFLYARDV